MLLDWLKDMVTPEEAEAILIGDSVHYQNTRKEALIKARDNYKANKGMVVKYDGLINTALSEKLTGTDIFNMDEMDEAGKLELGSKLTSGSWDAIVEQLRAKQGEYINLKNIANENYKNWYGSYFEEFKGGLTEEEIEAFNLQLKQEQEEKEEIKKEAEEKKLEETKQRYVEPEEEEKAKTYSVDKKDDAESLLTSYVEGNVSDSVLKNIGGQSLLNRARVMKNAYKGQKPKATVIPFVKTKGITPINMETLKETKFKNPGKSGTFSWEDITSDIYSGGKTKTEKGTSLADAFLTGKHLVTDQNLRFAKRRERAFNVFQKFQKLNISLEEFKEKYSKDYRNLVNLLAKSRNK